MCAVCAPLAHGLAAASFRAGLDSVLGALACAAVPAILFRQDAIGGGDVKLLAAIGALLGARLGLEAEMWAFLCSLPFLVAILRRQRQGKAPTVSELRFGPAVFVGVALALARQFVFLSGPLGGWSSALLCLPAQAS